MNNSYTSDKLWVKFNILRSCFWNSLIPIARCVFCMIIVIIRHPPSRSDGQPRSSCILTRYERSRHVNERTAPSSRLLLFKQDQLFIDLFNRADPKPSQCSVISSVTDTALKRQSTLLSVATRGQSGNGFGSLSCVCVSSSFWKLGKKKNKGKSQHELNPRKDCYNLVILLIIENVLRWWYSKI